MTDQVVEFVGLKETLHPFEDIETFQLREDRKAPWLQKLCFKVLRKLGAFHLGVESKIERHRTHGPTITARLFEQQRNLQCFFDRKATCILMGSEDYAEMMQEDIGQHHFSVTAQYNHGRYEKIGLTVHVIPWMRGILVMPDLERGK